MQMEYGEERSINIGDFESIKCFLKITDDIKVFNKDNGVYKISESKCTTVDEHSKDVNNTAKMLIRDVRSILDKRETQLRLWADNFVEFNHKEKLPENRDC